MRRNGWNYELFMLIFTQLKNNFFQGATFINCFRIFNVLQRNLFYIGYITSNLKTQAVEIALIQWCSNIATLKQCWTNIISTPCLQGNCLKMYQENIHNRVEGCNLSKMRKLIFITLHLMKLPKLPKSIIPPKRLWIDASAS